MALLALAGPARACVGDGCLNLYSTEADGGELTTSWDFASRTVQTFPSLCAGGTCLYTAIDPGFLTGGSPYPDGQYPLAIGVRVSLEVVARDPAVRFRLNGESLGPGQSGLIGTTPGLHNHPTWQLSVAEGVEGDFPLSFRFTTDSTRYGDSQTFTILLTNLPTPTPEAGSPSPSPSPTPTATMPPDGCAGDCNDDGQVTVSELIGGVAAALGQGVPCPALDRNGDGRLPINELIAAVNALLDGCPTAPTPTPTEPATLALIQETIFSPRCAITVCHDSTFKSGDLVLEPGTSYAQLVGVEPDVESARDEGLLRVDPGMPDNSFLMIKLEGPPPSQGGRMPLIGEPLSAEEIALIRAWIAAGAPP